MLNWAVTTQGWSPESEKNLDKLVLREANLKIWYLINIKFHPRKQILLFPSYLKHRVLKNNSDHERISLSFNVFVKGIIGSKISNTELKIGESNDR